MRRGLKEGREAPRSLRARSLWASIGRWLPAVAVLGLGFVSLGCTRRELVLVRSPAWKEHVYRGAEPFGDSLGTLRFKSSVCQGVDLAPAYQRLDENDLVRFLEQRDVPVRVERPRDDLAYVIVDDRRTRRPARLRVAILSNADAAGKELAEAIAQHGSGSWGVHRSNLAVLGPVGDTTHDLAFAAETQLVCWGVFTIVGGSEPVVIPGGYREL